MSEPKPIASLSPSLLARKGAARPAMRPQLQPLNFEDNRASSMFGGHLGHYDIGSAQEDLGWNDMGDTAAVPPVAAPAAQGDAEPAALPDPQPAVVPINGALAVETPVVGGESPALRQLDELAETIARAPALKGPRKLRSALKEGRKAAFTLRLDADRHLRLRLACTVQNRSAQALVTEALDRLLDDLPGLEDLSSRVRRH